jgi:hypothetical protein
MRQDRYRHQAIGLLLAALLTLLGAQRTAAAAETRTVQLQNGTIYSGELVEWVPEDHVTLRLITGEIHRIPWSELALQPQQPPPGAPPPVAPPSAPLLVVPPPPIPPPDAFYPPGGVGAPPPAGTLLTIRSTNPHAQLTQITGGGYVVGYGYGRPYGYGAATIVAWRTICTTPCNQVVPSGGSYRIAGPGIVPSRPFVLSPGSAELHVKAGRIGARIGGLFLTVLGGPSVIIGASLLGFSRTFDEGSPFYDPGERAAFRAGGGVLLGVGLGALVAGIATLATSGTRVRIVNTPGGAPNPVSLRLSSGQTLALSAQGLHF